jgi:hypothetical protein
MGGMMPGMGGDIGEIEDMDEEEIEEGAGFWEGTDAAEGARDARRSMNESVGYE